MTMIVLTNSIVIGSDTPTNRELDLERTADTELAQTATRIYNGVQESGYLTGDDDEDYFYIVVGSGAVSMHVVLDGPFDDDFDVYGRHNSYPSTATYDWRGYTSSADETVTHDYPTSGTWYIMVRSFHGSGTYYLTVTIDYGETTTSETTPPRMTGVFTPTLILGIAGVGVMIVVVVLIFVFMRGRGAPSGPEPFEVVYPGAPAG